MTRRLLVLALALNVAVAAAPTRAQQTDRIPIVGVLTLTAGPADPFVEALRQGLRELGYVEGRNIRIEFRTAQDDADRLPGLAEELVQLKVDVIVVTNPLAAQALQRATSTVPIVVALFDPVASGLIRNIVHPGGNVTGLSNMTIELSAKRLELLKEAIPRLTRVAVLWDPDMPLQAKMVEDIKAAAISMSIDLKFVGVRTPEEFSAAFSAVSRARAQALYVVGNPLFYIHRTALVKLASKARLPAIYTDEGGLMSYGANIRDQMRRSAAYVDKIFKGAKPGDLPIEQATKFEFVVNLKTAKAFGVTIPQSILVRADEVIR